MITVQGRVLPPPTVQYFNRRAITVGGNGSWNMKDLKYTVFTQLPRWSFLRISLQNDTKSHFPGDLLQQKLGEFSATLKDSGIRIPPHTPKDGYNVVLSGITNDETNKERLSVGFKSASDAGVRFLLVILPYENRLTYARV